MSASSQVGWQRAVSAQTVAQAAPYIHKYMLLVSCSDGERWAEGEGGEHDCVCSWGWKGHHVSQILNNKFWQVKNV